MLESFNNNKAHIILPKDGFISYIPIIIGDSPIYIENLDNKPYNANILDIGHISINCIMDIIDICDTIYLFGTPGKIEDKFFKNSTQLLFKILKYTKSKVEIFGKRTIEFYNNQNNV